MFKGRIKTPDYQSGNATATVGMYGIIYSWESINGVEIAQGQTFSVITRLNSTYDGYAFVELDDSDSILRIATESVIPESSHAQPEFTLSITNASTVKVGMINLAHPDPIEFDIDWFIATPESGLIENPVDAINHILRLQNWSELGITYDWGKEVVHEALIKLSGEGSFNSSTLDEIKALKIARQIFDYDKAWTDDLIHSLCEQFFLVSYQDENGYECLKSLLTKENPSTVITFADIIGDVGDMIEPRMQDIFCLPAINYGYDYALEKFTQQIRVENVWETTYSSDFTPGLDATDGPEIWALCRALWQKTRQIEPMPSNLTDRYWVPDYTTAVWCLKKQLQLMTIKRCSFSVGYTTGRKWDMGKHIKLQLPHETNNNAIECVVEEIIKSKRNNRVTVQVMLLDEIESSFFFEE